MVDAYTRLLTTGFKQPRHAVASVKRTAGYEPNRRVWLPVEVNDRMVEGELTAVA